MRTAIHLAFLKALSVALVAAIVGVGVFAIHLTHVTASITVTLGDQVPQQVVLADALDMSQLMPYPQHKPRAPK